MKFSHSSSAIVEEENSKTPTSLKSSNGSLAVISVETRINSMAAFKEVISTESIHSLCSYLIAEVSQVDTG